MGSVSGANSNDCVKVKNFPGSYDVKELEEKTLAQFAATSASSKGRAYPEVEHPYRGPFQRDRDRIIHSSAFRRLEGKTQVFIDFMGDYYRNRLTHTIEVSQISRTIARAFRLNEDLAEAVALAHDLGHSPFGHVGESMLHDLMGGNGGFEHNRQGLRVVDRLESRYPDFPGLNLSWEVREGIIKHRTDYDSPELDHNFDPDEMPTLEAQLVNVADEITYSCHDVDDGLKSGILNENALIDVSLVRDAYDRMNAAPHPPAGKMRRYHLVRLLIDIQVTALLEHTAAVMEEKNIRTLEDVRRAGCSIVGFSKDMAKKNAELKKYLMQNFYRHSQVVESTGLAQKVIGGLFDAFMKDIQLIPDDIRERSGEVSDQRVVCDYIAGMTDRFAAREYEKRVAPL